MKRIVLSVCLIALFCVSAYIYLDIKNTKEDVELYARLKTGTIIQNFKLTDFEGKFFEPLHELKKPLLAIFVFSQKCPSCDPNLFYWTKLNTFFNSRMDFIGIILGTTEDLKKFKAIKKTSFDVYRTDYNSSLRGILKIRFRLSQTIILKHREVVYHKGGDLSVKEFFKIKNKIIGGLP